MLGRTREKEVIEGDDGWETVDDFGKELEGASAVEDPSIRNRLVEFWQHLNRTKGFDIDLEIPCELKCTGMFQPVPFSYSDYFGMIKELAAFAVQSFNEEKKGKSLVLLEVLKANYSCRMRTYFITMRVIDKSSLEIITYQTKVFASRYPFGDIRDSHVEFFRPRPADQGDSADSRDQKRTKLDGEVYSAAYGACSVCEKDLYKLLTDHARKYKEKFFLANGSVGLHHPFHRCRMEQSARAALAHYNETYHEEVKIKFIAVVEATLTGFASNQLEYDITFHALRYNPAKDEYPCVISFQAKVVYDNAQHEMVELKALTPTDIGCLESL